MSKDSFTVKCIGKWSKSRVKAFHHSNNHIKPRAQPNQPKRPR
jgi:hypothetical protein